MCCQPLEKEGRNKDRGRRIGILMPLFDDYFMMVEKKKRAMILKRKMCEDNSEKNSIVQRNSSFYNLFTFYSYSVHIYFLYLLHKGDRFFSK